MVNILDIYGVHAITINRMRQTPYGPTPSDPEQVTGCFVSESQRMVRAQDGTEVLSTAQVAVPHGTLASLTGEPTVTLPSGRTGRILSIDVGNSGGLSLPEHDVLNVE
ncbi:hypothetical protein [Schaalia cardiffensis]|uniref:hypothetical protein n=1 Tax=Schaalia cardiffensis TaxID=181487 RepID=UPI0023F14E6B|nr:hypothetical protein [Schaalia cardiffensis]